MARAAGVSEPMLYRHFGSKKALFLEVLKEIREATLTRWQTASADFTDPLAKLHAIADMYLGTTRVHAVEFRIMHRTLVETEDEEIVALLRSFYLDSEALLGDHIRRDGGTTNPIIFTLVSGSLHCAGKHIRRNFLLKRLFRLSLALALLTFWPIRIAVEGRDLFRYGGSDSGHLFANVFYVFVAWTVVLVAIGVRNVHGWGWPRSLVAVGAATAAAALLVLGTALL